MAGLPIVVKYILTAIVGMIPIIELRGAIPVGVFTFHLNYVESFLCSFIGNILLLNILDLYLTSLEDGNHLRLLLIGLLKEPLKKLKKVKDYKILQH